MSTKGFGIVRELSQDHDNEVEFWKDELVKLVEKLFSDRYLGKYDSMAI